MDKNKIVSLMQQNNKLILTNPYYYRLYNSMSFTDFNEESLVEFIKLSCELIEENQKDIKRYVERFGYLD